MIAAARVANPFPGLRPYQPSESDLFFGRDEQIGELLGHLRKRHLVGVVGASGSGKSSLVSAGLVPAVERGYLVGASSEWRIATLRPGGDPMGELARKVGAGLGISEADAVAELSRSSLGLADLARRNLRSGENLLVVVDQFEELFRYHKDSTRREEREASAAFVKVLLTAAGRAEVPVPGLDNLPVFVVLTMRSDYLGKSSLFRGLPEALNESQYLVPRMTREQLQEAIEGPVGMAGARITPALVQRLLNDTADDPNQLPVLQHVLMRVWEVSDQAKSRVEPMDLPHYGSVGGMARALNLDAYRAFARLGSDEYKEEFARRVLLDELAIRVPWTRPQEIARRIFQRLVEPGAKDEESRRPTRLSEIIAVCAASENEVGEAIQPFRERGFLVLSDDADPVVDISHESLIRLWDQLKGWESEESDSASVYSRLADWVKEDFELYSGLALDQALHWKSTENPNDAWARRYRPEEGIFARALDFLERSRKAREDAIRVEEERRDGELRRARLVAIVVGVAFLIAVAFGAYAYVQRAEAKKQADTATSGRLAMAALLNKDTRADLAGLLSIEGRRVTDSFETRNSLLSSLQANPGLIAYLHLGASVHCTAFSPDGKTLVSGSEDGTLRLWDVASHQPLGDLLKAHSSPVNSVAFSPDGKILAAGSDDKTIWLWDVASRQPLGDPLKGHSMEVSSVAFSPDGKLLASGGEDGAVRLWDVALRQPLGDPLLGPTEFDNVYSVAFSPDSKLLASASLYKAVQLWDVASRQPLGDPLKGDDGHVNSVAFSPDGKLLASAGTDDTVHLWDVARRRPLGDPLKGHLAAINSVAFSPDGQMLVSASADNTARLWDVANRQPLGDPIRGHYNSVNSVAFSPAARVLALASEDQTVALWDLANRQLLGDPLESPGFAGRFATSMAFSLDGKLLASGGGDGAVRLWDVYSRRPLGDPLKGHSMEVSSVAFSPDGKLLASAGRDKTVRLWDVARRQPSGEPLKGHSDWVQGVAFSPDGKLLASASNDGTVRLWDVASLQPLGDPLKGHSWAVYRIAFSPDGRLLASPSADTTVRLWDVALRRPLGDPLKGHTSYVYEVAFSPDGKMLVSGSEDGTVRLWDVARRQPLGDPLKGSDRSAGSVFVHGVAFSPDGKMVASSGGDDTVRLWDVNSRRPVGAPMTGHHSTVTEIAFSPDGNLLASAGSDPTVRLWDIDPNSWVTRLCRIANRNLSAAEWQQYIPNAPYRRTCPNLPPGEGAPPK